MVRDRLKRLVSVAPHQILDRQDTKVRRGSPAPEPLPKLEDFVRQDCVRFKSRRTAIGDFGAGSSPSSSNASSRRSSSSSTATDFSVDKALARLRPGHAKGTPKTRRGIRPNAVKQVSVRRRSKTFSAGSQSSSVGSKSYSVGSSRSSVGSSRGTE